MSWTNSKDGAQEEWNKIDINRLVDLTWSELFLDNNVWADISANEWQQIKRWLFLEDGIGTWQNVR